MTTTAAPDRADSQTAGSEAYEKLALYIDGEFISGRPQDAGRAQPRHR